MSVLSLKGKTLLVILDISLICLINSRFYTLCQFGVNNAGLTL